MTFAAGEIVTADKLNAATEKVIARGRRVTTSSASTGGIVGVLRIDGVQVRSGYLYKICTSSLALQSNTLGTRIRATIRHESDGDTATTSSTELPGSRAQVVVGAADQGEGPTITALYSPSGDETLSLLLCVQRASSVGGTDAEIFADSTVTIDMWVEQAGEDPGDTGVDV